ncbi:MAG: TIGR03663 family protein [Anaerolineae bacterium]|nr:TIGR03663 family protein [Anaerolineae bacterium]
MTDSMTSQSASLRCEGLPLARWERIFAAVILVLALITRFAMLDTRAISHDESIHTKFSWNLYAGEGFQHNPMMHGPLLFELTALSYHLFGPNDLSSRIVPALVGVALVMAPLLFRRWLSRTGALATSFLLLISPSISYYSRYIRHDVLLMLSAVLLLWVILQYLETGHHRWLAWLAACFSVMYATKEASYFYTAIFGLLLFVPFAVQVLTIRWPRRDLRSVFFALLVAMVVLGAIFVMSFAVGQMQEMTLDEVGDAQVTTVMLPGWGRAAAGAALLVCAAALFVMVAGIGRETMGQYRLYNLLMVLGMLTLPLGSAFLIKFAAGVDMQVVYDAVRTGNFASVPTPTVVALFGVVLATLAVSAGIGLWWDRKLWPWIALIHYTIFFVLYTTVFTWGFGAISGLVGGLAYWLAQQGVKRGNQPGYYYFLIGPLYEYLAIALSAAGGVAALRGFFGRGSDRGPEEAPDQGPAPVPSIDVSRLIPLFLLGWALMSWAAYTYAGEKMPWLLVHMALPTVFLGGWWVGHFVDTMPWSEVLSERGWVFAAVLPLFIAAVVVLATGLGQSQSALASGIPTAGPRLDQLRPIGATLGGLAGAIFLGGGLVWSGRRLAPSYWLRLLAVLVALVLGALTVRTMVMANYVNYDLATELLVYAHGTPDIKIAMAKIEEVSWRVTGTAHGVQVAYGEDGSWPFTWYMVDFPNHYFYSTSPDAARLLECPVVIAGSPQYNAVEEILGDDYVTYEYLYLWWPIQDYFGLTWERVRGALLDPAMRAALWDIVWRRDYGRYAATKNPDNPFDLKVWPYRKDFRLYIRRELAAETWPLVQPGSSVRYAEPVATEPPDPYVAGERSLPILGEVRLPGSVIRGVARAGDGTFYIADTLNHRIWHVDGEGVLGSFGEYGAAPGQLNEPWGVAVDDAGHVYVADTWNHRIQMFGADGQVLATWGGLVQVVETGVPSAEGLFYGPRGLALGPNGELFVTDTGNKRVQVFDLEGNFLREFGGGGTGPGQLDEPVGIAVNADGLVAVADTWNRRVQVFTSEGVVLRQWRIPSWDVSHPDEKPFLLWQDQQLFVTDPLRGRVLVFDGEGRYQWALSGARDGRLAFPMDVAVDDGILYVTDAHNGALVSYELP